MTGAGFLLSTVTLQFPTTHLPGGGSRNFLWWFGLIMAAPSGMSSKLHCRRPLELLLVTFPPEDPKRTVSSKSTTGFSTQHTPAKGPTSSLLSWHTTTCRRRGLVPLQKHCGEPSGHRSPGGGTCS